MSLNVQFIVSENKLTNEKIVTPRLVSQQTVDYDVFCDYLAQGSTVTAADVSAVMKQLEKNLPLILGLNARVMASPEGLVFRPTVKGSLTQSQLKKKLEATKAEYLKNGDTEAAGKIDVDRELKASDLTTGDLQACIVIDLPKSWETRFQQSVEFKRVSKATAPSGEGGENLNENPNPNENPNGGGNTGDTPPPITG